MTRFIEIRCCQCDEIFGMCGATYQTLERSGATWHCPFGHRQHFTLGPSEADKLRAALQKQEQETRKAREEAERERRWRLEGQEQRQHLERRLAATRGVNTRMRNRVANGVCPCCNRTFVNLARHMSTKHKGFVAEEVQAEHGQTIQ
jgi:hypothetical protein